MGLTHNVASLLFGKIFPPVHKERAEISMFVLVLSHMLRNTLFVILVLRVIYAALPVPYCFCQSV